MSKINAAGILFQYKDKFLLLHRTKDEEWGLPGGHMDEGESPLHAAIRETFEECGMKVTGDMKELGNYDNFMVYHGIADKMFTPSLNSEHDKFIWTTPADAPSNLHGCMDEILKQQFTDSSPTKVLRRNKNGDLQLLQDSDGSYRVLMTGRVSGRSLSSQHYDTDERREAERRYEQLLKDHP